MAKNSNKKSRASSWDAPMTSAMKFFLAGCVAELFMLVLRRYYYMGVVEHMLAWYRALPYLAIAGFVILVAGIVLRLLWKNEKKKKRNLTWYVIGGGAFLAAACGISYWNMDLVPLLCTLIPIVMVMGILWNLYDHECALALTVLGSALVVLWLFRRVSPNLRFGTLAVVGVVVFIVALAALVYLARSKKLGKLLPARADLMPVYVSCGVSAAALAAALISTTIAYYAMWVLAFVVFALAVYYTVKQL